MLKRLLSSSWWLLAVAVGLGSLSGCRCGCFERVRHGCILRGSFSLEFNRVPWINSRCETLGECSELDAQLAARRKAPWPVCPDCAGCDSAVPETVPTPPAAPSAVPGAEMMESLGSTGCACPGGCAGVPAGPIRSGLARAILTGHFVPPRPKVIEEPYLGPSRFHPVPSRPVFSPREEMYAAAARPMAGAGSGPARGATITAPRPLAAQSGAVARELAAARAADAAPPAPVPEHLATLPDEPPETTTAPRGSAPRRLSPATVGSGTGAESWVFIPPAEPKKLETSVPAPAQETTRSNGWVRRR